MSENENVRLCPLCGGDVEVDTRVECCECGLSGPAGDKPQDTIRKWHKLCEMLKPPPADPPLSELYRPASLVLDQLGAPQALLLAERVVGLQGGPRPQGKDQASAVGVEALREALAEIGAICDRCSEVEG
jgi:hypothetical protein